MVVAGSGLPDSLAVTRFAQLAVLYWEEHRQVDFTWLGPLHPACAERLHAAGVKVVCEADTATRAAAMSQAWAYVSLGLGDGFPSLLAEAMASGIPAISWNQHQACDYVVHDVDGLIANNETSLLRCTTALLGSMEMRSQFGLLAREKAKQRFHRSSFELAVLDVYAKTMVPVISVEMQNNKLAQASFQL